MTHGHVCTVLLIISMHMNKAGDSRGHNSTAALMLDLLALG